MQNRSTPLTLEMPSAHRLRTGKRCNSPFLLHKIYKTEITKYRNNIVKLVVYHFCLGILTSIASKLHDLLVCSYLVTYIDAFCDISKGDIDSLAEQLICFLGRNVCGLC